MPKQNCPAWTVQALEEKQEQKGDYHSASYLPFGCPTVGILKHLRAYSLHHQTIPHLMNYHVLGHQRSYWPEKAAGNGKVGAGISPHQDIENEKKPADEN